VKVEDHSNNHDLDEGCTRIMVKQPIEVGAPGVLLRPEGFQWPEGAPAEAPAEPPTDDPGASTKAATPPDSPMLTGPMCMLQHHGVRVVFTPYAEEVRASEIGQWCASQVLPNELGEWALETCRLDAMGEPAWGKRAPSVAVHALSAEVLRWFQRVVLSEPTNPMFTPEGVPAGSGRLPNTVSIGLTSPKISMVIELRPHRQGFGDRVKKVTCWRATGQMDLQGNRVFRGTPAGPGLAIATLTDFFNHRSEYEVRFQLSGAEVYFLPHTPAQDRPLERHPAFFCDPGEWSGVSTQGE